MTLLYPELLLLAIPAALVWALTRRGGRSDAVTEALRIGLAALLLLACAQPQRRLGGRGTDVIVVVDRSLSMPPGAEARIEELLGLASAAAGRHDRLGLVTFGERVAVERTPRPAYEPLAMTRDVGGHGSDLAAALDAALGLFHPDIGGRILVLSDGGYTGASPTASAVAAAARRVAIDYRAFERPAGLDVAVDSLDLPPRVAPMEAFQFSAWVYASRAAVADVRLRRGGRELSRGEAALRPGMNRLVFRDVVAAPGLHRYEVSATVEGDVLPENNVGRGSLVAEGRDAVLVVNEDGRMGNLARALAAGGLSVQATSPGAMPQSPAGLAPFAAVVMENVAAQGVGPEALAALGLYVEEAGGGLVMTGGKSSFGAGGYRGSPIEPLLPVALESPEETRKLSVAIAVVLDRSGSMMAPVAGGKTKMDLANLGTAEVISMLSSADMVTVIAGDTAPHVIVPPTMVTDPAGLRSRVLRIESMGGGIFVYVALKKAGALIADAPQATKHIILFTDAADTEQPGDYKNLLARYRAAGITVSVIGLGTERDVDADLCKDIAERGGGRIFFTEDAAELPFLFAQEALTIVRPAFIEEPVGVARLPGLHMLGPLAGGEPPALGGYNVSFQRPDAATGLATTDENAAPVLAFWHRGLGRVAAFTGEADGLYTGPLADWPDYGDFFVTLARWAALRDEAPRARATLTRDGADAVLRIELDPERFADGEGPLFGSHVRALAVPPGRDEATREVDLHWASRDVLVGRFRLSGLGPYMATVHLGERAMLRSPPVELPYSPEYAPRTFLDRGVPTLRALAGLTGGRERINMEEAFEAVPGKPRSQPLGAWLAAAAVAMLVAEIAGRRLSLWRLMPTVGKMADTVAQAAKRAFPAASPGRARPGRTAAAEVPPPDGEEAPPAAPPEDVAPKPAPDRPAADPFAAAKRRAGRRFRER